MKLANWLRNTQDRTLAVVKNINNGQPRITEIEDGYFIQELDLLLPKNGKLNFVLDRFDTFVSNKEKLAGSYTIEGDALFFDFDNKRIIISNVSDIFIINEIFVEKCYNFILPSEETITVIDVGMNVGLASLFFAENRQVDKVYGFEPFLPTYELAQQNFSYNPKISKKIVSFGYGLGKKEESITVNYNPEKPGINATLNKSPWFDNDVYKKVSIQPANKIVANIIEEGNHSSVLLKIDCEGAEYAIFESLFSHKLPKQINIIMLEWHFQGSEMLEQPLAKNGFKLISSSLGDNSGLIYAIR